MRSTNENPVVEAIRLSIERIEAGIVDSVTFDPNDMPSLTEEDLAEIIYFVEREEDE